jgi:hypothetical protein
MKKRPVYDYRVFLSQLFLEAFETVRYPDAYLAADSETEALQQALAEGYRLYQMAGEFVVLEKALSGQDT